MTFTYSGDPSTSVSDEVRFYIGDTVEEMSYISDEEIAFVLAKYDGQFTHTLGFAALCAEMIAAKVAREVSVSADGVSVSSGELQSRFNELAVSLRDQYRALSPSGVFETVLLDPWDPTIEPLAFGLGFTDNPEAGAQDLGRISRRMLPEY